MSITMMSSERVMFYNEIHQQKSRDVQFVFGIGREDASPTCLKEGFTDPAAGWEWLMTGISRQLPQKLP